MRPLATIERFIERLFEQPTARLFHARLQPIQVQRRIERAMESNRQTGADRTIVPNQFRVRLNPRDLAAFQGMSEALAVELAEAALTFARSHAYTLLDRPRVEIVRDAGVSAGEIVVDTRIGRPVAAGTDDQERAADARQDLSQTRIFTIPAIEGPLATLREIRRDGTGRRLTVDGRPLTIGRSADNGLVLVDSRVSRHHARIQARRGALVFTDLGSTNGSRVNGSRVAEVVLGEGDRIEMGETVLVVESVPEGRAGHPGQTGSAG